VITLKNIITAADGSYAVVTAAGDTVNPYIPSTIKATYTGSVDTANLSSRIDLKLSISDTATMLANYALLSETGSGDLSASDTAAMLTPYIREAEVIALGYMALTDTGAMLLPYIREAEVLSYGYMATDDTAAMLAPYALLSEVGEATGIAASDTAAMLSPYIRAAEVAAGYDATGTASGLISTHESTYNHSNFATAFDWGDHATAGYEPGLGNPAGDNYVLSSTAAGVRSWVAQSGGSSTITDLGATAWRVFYSNGSGEVTELALGADGTYLRSNGVSAAPTFSTPSRTGDMLASVYDTDGNDVVDEAETAATVTGFSRGSGSLALVGDDGITLNTTATTSVTLPTSGTLATTSNINDSLNARIGDGIILSDVALMLDDTASMLAPYALLSEVGTGDVSITDVRSAINDSLNVLRPLYLPISDTASMLANYALLSEVGSGSEVTITTVRDEIADSLNAIRIGAIQGVAVVDSNQYKAGGYATPTWVDTQIAAVETGTVDSSLYVTVTRLTDSLATVRSEISYLISIMEDYGLGDITRPTIMSTEIGTYNDSILLTIWSENLQQDSIPPTSAFSLTEDGNTFGIEAITINEDSLFIALDSTGTYGSEYRLSYTPGTPALQDSAGNPVAAFSNRLITNNFEAPPAGVPTFLSDGHTYAWLKAEAEYMTTYESSTAITKWADASGNGNDFVTSSFQGYASRIWDATNQEVHMIDTIVEARLENSVAGDSLETLTIFMVVRINGYIESSMLMGLNHNPGAMIMQGGSANDMVLYAGNWGLAVYNVGSGYGILTAIVNTTNSSLQWNDLTASTGDAGSVTFQEFYLGNYTNSTLSSFKEIIIRDNVATAQEIIDVKAYLNEKYGLGL